MPEDKTRVLIELLEQAILQGFPELTLAEPGKMIQLTPLEETVAGQELIRMGKEKGKSDIILKQLRGRFGSLSTSLERKLRQSNTETLDRFGEAILDFDNLEDAEKWLKASLNRGESRRIAEKSDALLFTISHKKI